MTRKRRKSLTLGELIAAVNGELSALKLTARHRALLTACILNDLFANNRARLESGARLKVS
jgi:hypothetical protein